MLQKEIPNIFVEKVFYNLTPAILYEHALKFEESNVITNSGALSSLSGIKTGRSPKDKRIVKHSDSERDVNWGNINIPITQECFSSLKKNALGFLNKQPHLYICDVFAGWEKKFRLKVRVICTRPYHALFVNNMFIIPNAEELKEFNNPDCVIYNAGCYLPQISLQEVDSKTNISLNLETKEMIILGTEYAGEMKKGIFTLMNYLMPKQNVLSMHCSVTEGHKGDVSIFLGLSGTGKTTLSADPNRKLIGDDEHCWHDNGIFNIEGGCYAKCDNLSKEKEPEIFAAIGFGSLLENVVIHPTTRIPNYNDLSITENTRASYKLESIPSSKIPAITTHANNIIFLTCDAFGVLPAVSLLTPEQALYYFISGYTAKISGTEVGIKEPVATFSACFGAPFMVFSPIKYADLLKQKLQQDKNINTWLINTGWIGGAYGVGERISLKYTRAIIDAIHDGTLIKEKFINFEIFNLKIPKNANRIPNHILNPKETWKNKLDYDNNRLKLAKLFIENFKNIQDINLLHHAGPQV